MSAARRLRRKVRITFDFEGSLYIWRFVTKEVRQGRRRQRALRSMRVATNEGQVSL